MKNILKYPAITIMFLCVSSSLNIVYAGNSSKADTKQFSKDTSYTWYDGNKARKVWLNPNLIAEFDPKPADHSQSKGLAAIATRINGKQHTIQLWRLKTGDTGKAGMQYLKQAVPQGKISPVLHDGPSEAGRKRALPGNIIVHLDPNWDPQQVQAWFRQHALQVVKPLNIGPNIFVTKTGPGLEALEKANEIYLSGEVVAAYPDWWQEVSKR